jgi:predicted metal-dependent peptidase
MMMEQNLTAERKMSKARTMLVLDDPFAGALSMKMNMRELTEEEYATWSTMHPGNAVTCMTDGKSIAWGRDYVDNLPLAEAKGLIAHEVYHTVFKHHLRRGDRDPQWWNIAGDKIIDSILKEANYQVPNSLADPQFIEMTTEQVYKLIVPPISNPKNGSGKGKGKGKSKDKSGGTGQNLQGGGLVVDAPINMKDKAAIAQMEEDWQIAIEQAAKSAKAAGRLPGRIAAMIETEKEHVVNWRDMLRDFMEKCAMPGDYTWARPNRRFISAGMYLPSLDEEYDNPQIIVACDTSGSVSQDELKQYAAEISGILEEFPSCEFKVMYGDTSVRHEEDFDNDSLPIKLEARGGGGTNFMPFFDEIADRKLEAEALIFFTDMGAFDWDKLKAMGEPGIPVLWLNTYRGSDDMDVPFGQIVPLEIKDD